MLVLLYCAVSRVHQVHPKLAVRIFEYVTRAFLSGMFRTSWAEKDEPYAERDGLRFRDMG